MDWRPRIGPLIRLCGLLLLGGVSLAALHASGGGALAGPNLTEPGSWTAWAAQRTPLEAAAALLRLGAMAMAGWLLGTIALGLALRVAPSRFLRRLGTRVTPRAVRRLVEAALGASLSLTAVLPTVAIAATADDVAVLHRLDGTRPPPRRPAPRNWRRHPNLSHPAGLATVERGDHFWAIAARVLEDAWGRAPADNEIAPYWRSLISENRGLLARAGDPNLIYAGQTFAIPPPPAAQ